MGLTDLEFSETTVEQINKVIEDFSSEYETDTKVLKEVAPEVFLVVDKISDKIKDGFQFSDLTVLAEIIPDVWNVASNVANIDDKTKHDLVIDCVLMIYYTIDTYPDGKQNNINVPIVFGSTEKGLEAFVVRSVVRLAMSLIVDLSNKND